MYKSQILTVMLYFYFLSTTMTQAQKDSSSYVSKESSKVTIILRSFSITDKTLEINYQINNDSDQDIWICEGINHNYWNFEVGMAKDGQTLIIRRCLNVPMFGFGEQPFGHYARLHKKKIRKESLLFTLPVHPYHIFLEGRQLSKVIEDVKSLVVQIGFYSGDMPKMIFDMLEEADKAPQKKHTEDNGYPIDVIGWFKGTLYFNEINERIRNRDEQVIIPWTNQTLRGEQIIRASITNLNVPYLEYPLDPELTLPNLDSCTKIGIEYRPSVLDYFFNVSDQKLMNKTEIDYLQSHKNVFVDDKRIIGKIIGEINQAYRVSKIVTESKSAHIGFYNIDECLTSLDVYGEYSVLNESNQCLWHRGSLNALEMSTAEIEPFKLRVQCAANIKNLWYRLHLYHITVKTQMKDLSNEDEMMYPSSYEWCDCMLRAYTNNRRREKYTIRMHKCPSAGEGNCNYAMNPNCKYVSPPDTVLLFETNAGWNQHGGPELFTFDNHDPKGGCVLLNDGTVKFIRTKEELQQLRWK